jgi:uncharacterized protein YkwD
MMMKRLPNILIGIIFISLSVLASSAAYSEEAFTNEMETQLLEWINGARANPLEMAETVGLDPDQVLIDLPELYDDLTQGLAPLRPDSALTDAARSHTRDMLENDFYGRDSSSGNTLADRVLNTGYEAEIIDESLGILGFFNFIDPAEAVFRIFSTLYRSELDPERSRAQNIFNPEFKDVGIGFGAGKLTLEGEPYNVYVVTCDFAKAADQEEISLSATELEIARMINQLRGRPLEVMISLGIDVDSLIENEPGLLTVLETPVFPLVPSASLQAASRAHSRDMLLNGFVGPISSDGKSLEDRMVATGYIQMMAGEAIQFVESDIPYGIESLHEMLRNLAEGEIIHYMNSGELTLLNPDFVDMGVGVEAGTLGSSEEATDGLVTTVTMGATGDWKPLYVVGTVYTDDDHNGLQSVGEGIPGVKVTIEGMDNPFESGEFKETYTNGAGMFVTPIDIGSSTVTIFVPEGEPVEYSVSAEAESVWLEHCLSWTGEKTGE